MNNSIGGLKENIVSFVVLICSLITGVGIIISLGALIFEPNNTFVRDYAKQSLLFSIVFSLLTILSAITYLFTLFRLCVIQSISQFSAEVVPPLLHAET